MVVAQHHRTPGADIIDIGLSIHVIEVSAIRAFDKQRGAADAAGAAGAAGAGAAGSASNGSDDDVVDAEVVDDDKDNK